MVAVGTTRIPSPHSMHDMKENGVGLEGQSAIDYYNATVYGQPDERDDSVGWKDY